LSACYVCDLSRIAVESRCMQMTPVLARAQSLLPGIAVSAIVGMAAAFVSQNLGGPTLIYALLLGMAFHFLSQGGKTAAGIQYSSRTILRLGVALLGARISYGQIAELGLTPILIIVTSVAATILFGRALATRMGLTHLHGILVGGATAICGASAALAISAVLPKHKDSERDTLFAVISVTVLSTIAMVLYPILIRALGYDDNVAGIIIGGTIHDVAQVVGAGYLMSNETGLVATYIKLLRVSLLMPVVMGLVWLFREQSAGTGAVKQPLLPSFLAAFAALVIINSLGFVPARVSDWMAQISRACLVCAIAALGMKTSLQDLAKLGWKPLAHVIAVTVFLLLLVLLELRITGIG
jgi:uncharacterized integral membrane protein (TIGR00698 family)